MLSFLLETLQCRGAGSTLALVRVTNTSLVPRPMGTRLTNTAMIIAGPRAKRGNFCNCAFLKEVRNGSHEVSVNHYC